MEEDNFQTLNIKYKIKKIKNKKRNIQNIEPFETLSNVGPILDTNHNNNVAKNLDNPNLSYKEGFKEGMQKIEDNDYEGLDDVLSQAGNEENIIAEKLTDFINQIYISLITFNCLIAFSIANSTRKGRPDSGACGGDVPTIVEYTDPKTGKIKKKAAIDMNYITSIIEIDYGTVKYGQVVNTDPITGGNENLDPGLIRDANAVYRYVCLFEAVIATFLFTFVWFHIIFYSYSNNIKNDTFFNIFNREELRKNNNIIVKILFFIFEFGIAVFEDIRWFCEKKFPENALIINRPFCFLLLFLIILNINHKYISYLKDLLIDILHVNYKNFFVIILYLIVIYELISIWVIGNIENAKKANSENPLDQASFLMTAAVQIMPFYVNPFIAVPNAIYKCVKELFRIIIALVFSVPMGALLCILYFLYLSLIFPIFNLVFKNDFVENIYNYIRSDGAFSDKDPCNIPTTYWGKIFDNIINFFSYLCIAIFNVLPYLVLIIFSAYYIQIHLLDGLDCPGTSKFLQGINFLILALGILGLIYHFREILKSSGEGFTVFSIIVTPPMALTLGLMKNLIKILPIIFLITVFIFIILSIKTIFKVIKEKSYEAKNKVEKKTNYVQEKVSSNTPGSS